MEQRMCVTLTLRLLGVNVISAIGSGADNTPVMEHFIKHFSHRSQ